MTILAALALLAWLYLALAHGRFWQSGPVLPPAGPGPFPDVAVVVPARDEAPQIESTVRSLLEQVYAGRFRVVVVDDGSTDGTGDILRGIDDPRLTVVDGEPRPPGWSGKLWAVSQGIAATEEPWLLLADADVLHDPGHLAALASKAERGLDLVSEMVALRCESPAERALVPAFVYFFQMLYPFALANDDARINSAAAAGGTMFLSRAALDRIGGIASIRGALIDDVTLAAAIKKVGRIWIGHGERARSLRPYPTAGDVWRMVARTAYVQLRRSPAILAGTVLGLALLWIVPPLAAILGHGSMRTMGLIAWIVAGATYLPTLRRFGMGAYWAPALPAVAVFYMAATIGSAVDHHAGRGAAWKGRDYRGTEA